jgi:hypothetical protein
MEKIDRLMGNFLESNAAEREGTKSIVRDKVRAGREGRGVDWAFVRVTSPPTSTKLLQNRIAFLSAIELHT